MERSLSDRLDAAKRVPCNRGHAFSERTRVSTKSCVGALPVDLLGALTSTSPGCDAQLPIAPGGCAWAQDCNTTVTQPALRQLLQENLRRL